MMNTSPIKFSPCIVNFPGPTLAYHSACVVLPSDIAHHPRINIYKFGEEKVGRRSVVKVKNI